MSIIEWSISMSPPPSSSFFGRLQAALKALYGMENRPTAKCSVYRHHRLDEHRGAAARFDDEFVAPPPAMRPSTGISSALPHPISADLAESEEAGVYLAATMIVAGVVNGHPEYDA